MRALSLPVAFADAALHGQAGKPQKLRARGRASDPVRKPRRRAASGALLLGLLLSLLVLPGCGSQEAGADKPAVPDSAVAVDDNVAVRTDPISMAAEVDSLRAGSRVRVLRQSPEPVRIGKFNEHWYYVQLDSGLKGWVYGAKLSLGDADSAAASQGLADSFQKQLVGKWWEVRSDGSTGFRKFAFWPDQKYKYGYGARYYTEGKFEIVSGRRLVYLDKGSGVGGNLSVKQIGNDLRLQVTHKGTTYTFRRGDADPDAEEVGTPEGKSKSP